MGGPLLRWTRLSANRCDSVVQGDHSPSCGVSAAAPCGAQTALTASRQHLGRPRHAATAAAIQAAMLRLFLPKTSAAMARHVASPSHVRCRGGARQAGRRRGDRQHLLSVSATYYASTHASSLLCLSLYSEKQQQQQRGCLDRPLLKSSVTRHKKLAILYQNPTKV